MLPQPRRFRNTRQVTAGGLHAGYRIVITAVEHEHNPWRDVGKRIERECRELVEALIRNKAGAADVEPDRRVRACVFQKAAKEGAQ